MDEQHPSSLQSIMVNAEIEIQQNDMNLIMVEDGLCQMQYENGRKAKAAEESFAHNSHEKVGGPTLYVFPFVWPPKTKVNLHCDEQMLYGNDQSCELFGEFILTGGCTLSSVAEIRPFVKVSLLMLLATNIIIHF